MIHRSAPVLPCSRVQVYRARASFPSAFVAALPCYPFAFVAAVREHVSTPSPQRVTDYLAVGPLRRFRARPPSLCASLLSSRTGVTDY